VPAWFRHAVGRSTAASGSVDLTSVWVVRLSDANHGTFDVRPSTRFGTGTLRYDGSRGGWVVDVLNRNCGGHDGVYRVTLGGPLPVDHSASVARNVRPAIRFLAPTMRLDFL